MPRPGTSLWGRPNGRRFQCVCKFSRVFDHVKPPKNGQKKENPNEINRALLLSGLDPKKNPYEINRTLRLSGLGPNEKDNITLNNQAS